jgi:hypothetical protein
VLSDYKNKRRFQRAQREAGPDEMVCGTIGSDGNPTYFVMPRDASDEDVRGRAFEIREGRSLSGYERSLMKFSERA